MKSAWAPVRVYEEKEIEEPEQEVKKEEVAQPVYTVTPPLSPGPNRLPSRPETPVGPHPDKRSNKYTSIGEERERMKPKPGVLLEANMNYLRVEGPVDRRIRTVSVVHKKNACYGPSVQDVRKSGYHIMKGSQAGLFRARGVVPEPDFPRGNAAWDFSATLQGIGNPKCLIDILPESCRFGPLRVGHIYRMALTVRNCDIDSTRFTAKLITPHPQLKVVYAPGAIPPGLSRAIMVEMIGSEAGTIESVLEITTKAHIAKVAIAGKMLDHDDFGRLDAEFHHLHGRRLGAGKGVVVMDDMYSAKILGDAFMPTSPFTQESDDESPVIGSPNSPAA